MGLFSKSDKALAEAAVELGGAAKAHQEAAASSVQSVDRLAGVVEQLAEVVKAQGETIAEIRQAVAGLAVANSGQAELARQVATLTTGIQQMQGAAAAAAERARRRQVDQRSLLEELKGPQG